MAKRGVSNIVCKQNVRRYYADNAEMLKKYRQIAESGKCPFCAPNIDNKFFGETSGWNIVYNQFPYKNSRLHLLLLPKRHIVHAADMTPDEWADLGAAVRLTVAKAPWLANGFGLALRVGEVGGVSLYHLHFHLIAPEIGEKGQIPVSFGIG